VNWRARLHELRISAHAVWIGARDPEVPLPARIFGMAVAAYALSPIDLIPDFIPVLGLLDDLILIPLGVWLFLKMIPAELHARHRAEAETASQKPVSRTGAMLVVLLWALAALWLGSILWSMRFY
jgi:uncharacterized membrane protein YkvA (DUF1232 family)